jgi:DNA-binding response OmpR family regulator
VAHRFGMPPLRGCSSLPSQTREWDLAAQPPTLVLLIEDEFLIQDLIETTLEDAGYTVIVATTGQAGLMLVEREAKRASGIVTDVKLGPGPSGWDVARRAREFNSTLPIVYVTGDSEHDYATLGLPNSLLIQKPFVGGEIAMALATLKAQASSAPG